MQSNLKIVITNSPFNQQNSSDPMCGFQSGLIKFVSWAVMVNIKKRAANPQAYKEYIAKRFLSLNLFIPIIPLKFHHRSKLITLSQKKLLMNRKYARNPVT